MKRYIGVDIGGTKVLSILTDERGEIIDTCQTKSNTDSREALFASVTTTIDTLITNNKIQSNHIEAIGVGLPGLVDTTKGIAVYQSNIPWHDFPIAAELNKRYNTKVAIDNDVATAAQFEWHNCQQPASFVYVTVSTGIAMTTIIDGKVIRGNGFAGELGQTFIDHNGTHKRLEQVIGGPALQQAYQSRAQDNQLTTKDLFDHYDKNPHAQAIIDDAAKVFSVSLYQINAMLDPESIVFGGSVMTHNPTFLDKIKVHLSDMLLPDQKHILEQMHVSQQLNMQGAQGAVLLAMRQS